MNRFESDDHSVEQVDSQIPKARIVSLGKVEELTFGGGKTWEDNGAIYQRG